MHYILKERIKSYTQWRKGVFLVAPLEVVLMLVVLVLIITTFIVSNTRTAGKLSITNLMNYLQGLQAKLANPGAMDMRAEQDKMEQLLRKVKANCEEQVISGNEELRELVGRTYFKMDTVEPQQAGRNGSWLQLKGVTNSFYESYFAAPGQLTK